MTWNKRGKAMYVAFASLAVLLLSLSLRFLTASGGRNNADTERSVKVTNSLSNTHISALQKSVVSKNDDSGSLNSLSSGAKQPLPIKTDKALREDVTARMWKEFYSIERENMRIVSDKTVGDEQRVVIEIGAPSQEQIERCHEVAAQLRRAIAISNPTEVNRSTELMTKLIHEGLSRPGKYRILYLRTYEPTGLTSLIERNTDDPEAFDFSGDTMIIPAVERAKREPDFQNKDSWGAKRYSHLFQLTEPDNQK